LNYGTRNLKLSKSVQCIETGIIYSSIKEAAADTGVSFMTISRYINGHGSNKPRKYHWIAVNK